MIDRLLHILGAIVAMHCIVYSEVAIIIYNIIFNCRTSTVETQVEFGSLAYQTHHNTVHVHSYTTHFIITC